VDRLRHPGGPGVPPRWTRCATGVSASGASGGLLGPEDTPEDGLADTPAVAAPATAPAAQLATPLGDPTPLDQPPYETDEFSGREGLGKEGVDTDVEAAVDLVLVAGADDGKGKVAGTGVGAEPSGSPKPVQAGHDHIQGDHIGPHLMNDFQTLGTIGRGHDLKPLQLEIDPDQLPDDLVVVHNKHPARRAWHNSRVGRDRPPRPGFPEFHPLRARHPR
jgi:hypothetical protein